MYALQICTCVHSLLCKFAFNVTVNTRATNAADAVADCDTDNDNKNSEMIIKVKKEKYSPLYSEQFDKTSHTCTFSQN